jgi:hypothetical protein
MSVPVKVRGNTREYGELKKTDLLTRIKREIITRTPSYPHQAILVPSNQGEFIWTRTKKELKENHTP